MGLVQARLCLLLFGDGEAQQQEDDRCHRGEVEGEEDHRRLDGDLRLRLHPHVGEVVVEDRPLGDSFEDRLVRTGQADSHAIDIDDALLPKVTGTDSSKIAAPWGGLNLGITQPRIVPVDADVFGAAHLVGLDPRYAIQRFVNVSASYDAIEEYVMRKATGFRVDFGEMSTRLYDEAWSVVSLEA